MLILTTKEAEAVAGESSPGHSIHPVALYAEDSGKPTGLFALSTSILFDDKHKSKREILNNLSNPAREVKPMELMSAEARMEE